MAEDHQGGRAVRAVRRCRATKPLKFCGDLKQDLKVEHIKTGLADHATLSFYRQGEFVDLCRGPHIPDAGRDQGVQAAVGRRLVLEGGRRTTSSCSGCTAPPSSARRTSTRYLKQIEEAKRRDHRVLGKQLGLFTISQRRRPGPVPVAAQGGDHPRPARRLHQAASCCSRGYQPVYTPHIGRVEMYETSGHFPYYRESQFPPIFGHPTPAQLVDYWITPASTRRHSSTADDREAEAAATAAASHGLRTFPTTRSTPAAKTKLAVPAAVGRRSRSGTC